MKKYFNLRLASVFLLGILAISACTQPYSQAPLASPTLLPTGLFVSPFPSGQDPLQIVADLGTQAAIEKTNVANGTTTPGTPITATLGTAITATLGTPVTATNTRTPSTPITAAVTTAVPFTNTPGGPSATPRNTVVVSTAVSHPASYTLHEGEFVFCIARRFNVNPDDILSMNGLADGQTVYPGRTLNIPTSGAFPGDRALRPHPATYSVTGNNDTTIYGVACQYGDVYPESIASKNNLAISATLNIGQAISIP